MPASCQPPTGAGPGGDGEVIQRLVHDLLAKQQALGALIDRCLAEEERRPGALPLQELAGLLALHSQNAARLGRLLRDQRALSGDAADGISGAISQLVDEIGSEWRGDL